MANVNVTLLDENDNSPKFTSSKYESKVFTNQTEGMLLVKVTKLYNTVYCPTNITVIQLINGSKHSQLKFNVERMELQTERLIGLTGEGLQFKNVTKNDKK